MPVNLFAGKSKAWLVERRNALQTMLTSGGGSQTHVAIAPGMYDEFANMSQVQLERQLMQILYALFLLDPDNFTNPYASKVMSVSTMYPGTYGSG